MRVVGLDVSRTVIEVAYLEDGQLRSGGRVAVTREALHRFASSLQADDHVVLEATGNTAAIAAAIQPHVAKVVVANPLLVRLIAEAKVKTDRIDAAVLAQLYASGFLPEVWIADEKTQALRRQASRRAQVMRQCVRLKNEIHSVLAAHLIAKCPASDLFGRKGRAWLAGQPLPMDERLGVEQRLRELDRLTEDLAAIDRQLGASVLDDPRIKRLFTITGINTTVAIDLVAAIGDIGRFASPEKLVSYFGLNPCVYQSGDQPARHGKISKRGRSHARAMLVEAAWAAAKAPGPLRAFFLRVSQRRGLQIAAVATARKLAVLVWHMLRNDQDYACNRPALAAMKRRRLELQAGLPAHRGSVKGIAADYSLKHVRDRERAMAEQAERSYARSVARWRVQPKPKGTGAATPTRDS